MFTGLVETQGRVNSLQPEGGGQRLIIASSLFSSDIALGESIAINGVCLTVVQHQTGQAAFQLADQSHPLQRHFSRLFLRYPDVPKGT